MNQAYTNDSQGQGIIADPYSDWALWRVGVAPNSICYVQALSYPNPPYEKHYYNQGDSYWTEYFGSTIATYQRSLE